ncbi:MAG: hydroxyacylglutathione hydrolase [Hyphomicrobiales bacterium]
MAALEVHQFICREDNYGVLLHDWASGATASIDAPDADAIETALSGHGWRLTHIFTTHHHADHVEGNLPLKERFGCRITGPAHESAPIPGIDTKVAGGEGFDFAGREVRVIDTPGHTAGHISYHLPQEHLAFVADTLFALGCGRVIEGTMEMMWQSLDKLRKLPAETKVHVGHEYTEANARFALTIEPDNRALTGRAERVFAARKRGEMTLPTTIGEELETNPFLRPDSRAIRARLDMKDKTDAEVFGEIRRRKDNFR